MKTNSEKIWYYLCQNNYLPHVLIIITIYQEDLNVLERTLLAVERINYPRDRLTIAVGDDGKKDDTRDYIHRRFPNVRYHRRTFIKGHAKAGNINDILFSLNGMNEIEYDGDYVLILDCDMAPLPGILSNMLPLFYNEDGTRDEYCCFIQSPQKFCNLKGIDLLGQNYNFFYKVVMKAYDGFKMGVPCCGTNVLFDRRILTNIGGMQYGSITEDFNTSLLLHSFNYHSKYYDGATAIGFAPVSLLDFYNQRERWTIGGLQIVFNRNYKEKFRNLPFIYKWIYTFSGASPILSFFMLVLLIGPILDLFSHDVFLCGLTRNQYLTRFLPYAIVYIIYLLLLHRNLPWPIFFLSLQESIFMIPFYIGFFMKFIFRILGFKILTFKVTPKKVSSSTKIDEVVPTVFILSPFVIYFLLLINSIYFSMKIGTFNWVDIGWSIFISCQLLNPLLFVLQSFLV